MEAAGERTLTAQMAHGEVAHKAVDMPAHVSKGKNTRVALRSDRLGINGLSDAVYEVAPHVYEIVEYKSTPVRRKAEVTDANILQLTLQRMCLEEAGNEVVGQSIYFTDHHKRIEVEISEEDRARAEETVTRTRAIVSADHSPPPLEDAPQCSFCSHISVCLPDEHALKTVRRRVLPSDPDGGILHLSEQGTRASISSGRIIVSKGKDQLGTVPLEKVQGIVIHGNIDVSSGLLRQLMWENVSVVWCSSSGRVYGWSRTADSPNGSTRSKQFVMSHTGNLPIASEMIAAKIHNQGTFLRRNTSDDTNSLLADLRALEQQAREAADIPSLFGIEGEAAGRYFANFSTMLNPEELTALGWQWPGRVGRGAQDPLNVLLNFCYSLLTTEAIRALAACGLDPAAGFLHSSSRNKPALALDLIEEFRAPVADSVVVSLVNRREIKQKDFSRSAGTVRLTPEGRKRVITAFEKRIQTVFTHPLFGYRVTWRRAIEVQARLILGVLDGSMDHYEGVKIR